MAGAVNALAVEKTILNSWRYITGSMMERRKEGGKVARSSIGA